jgi:hypothetical protein
MATITSKLKKGAGWGPLASHGSGQLAGVSKADGVDWFKIHVRDTEKGRLRLFALSMTKSELQELHRMIGKALEIYE